MNELITLLLVTAAYCRIIQQMCLVSKVTSSLYTRLLKTHFLTNSTDFMSLHSAAILTVLCYIVLPSRSGLRTLGIKYTFY